MEEQNVQAEIDEKELEQVRDIFRTLTIAIKTFNLYPKDNPIYQKVSSEICEKFNLFFESHDELSVDIEQNSLQYRKVEVFHSDEKTDNLSLLLFADGIRQINFYKGLTAEEIKDFIDILRFAFKSETSDDDDIVTLLWEKNIKNLGYSTVEDTIDDTLAVEERFLFEESRDHQDIDEITTGGLHPELTAASIPHGIKQQALIADELNILQDEFSRLEEKALLCSAVELFFDLLEKKDDVQAFPEIVQNLGKIIDIRMKNKEIKGAIEILQELKKISVDYSTPEQTELINAVVYKAGTPEKIGTLFRESTEVNDITKYLSLLDQTSVPNMILILGELQEMKQRKLLCEVLAVFGRHDINIFSDALNDERWFLVRNIAMILGMTKEPAAVKHLEKAFRHPNLKVRREVVKALENIGSDDTKALFLVALNDEDSAIRLKALKALRRFKDPALFLTLKKNASVEELKKKPFEEKKEILESLAVLGGGSAFPVLADLFRKKGFIEKDEITEIRASAAYGLGLINTSEALSLIENETGSKKSMLREACINAMKEAQKSGNNRR